MNAPTNLTVTGSDRTATFSWEDNSTDESGVMFETYNKQAKEWQGVNALLPNATTITWMNPNGPGGPQQYRVRMFIGEIGETLEYSEPSNVVTWAFSGPANKA